MAAAANSNGSPIGANSSFLMPQGVAAAMVERANLGSIAPAVGGHDGLGGSLEPPHNSQSSLQQQQGALPLTPITMPPPPYYFLLPPQVPPGSNQVLSPMAVLPSNSSDNLSQQVLSVTNTLADGTYYCSRNPILSTIDQQRPYTNSNHQSISSPQQNCSPRGLGRDTPSSVTPATKTSLTTLESPLLDGMLLQQRRQFLYQHRQRQPATVRALRARLAMPRAERRVVHSVRSVLVWRWPKRRTRTMSGSPSAEERGLWAAGPLVFTGTSDGFLDLIYLCL